MSAGGTRAAALALVLLPACGSADRTSTVPPDTLAPAASSEPEARLVGKQDVELPAGLVTIDSTAHDVDSDATLETVALYAQVETNAAGEPIWEDGHRWMLLVRDAGEIYPLVDAFVPFGRLGFAVIAGDGDLPPRIVAQRSGRDGVALESFAWDPARGGFTARGLEVRGTTVFRSRDVR